MARVIAASDRFLRWVDALEARHLESFSFAEVRRALQSLSSIYVERRERLATGSALETPARRAAFALFYGPLHFLTVRGIVRGLGAARPAPEAIVDLGCGTAAAAASWSLEAGGTPAVEGVDGSGWAVAEARWTLRTLGLRGAIRRGDAVRFRCEGRGRAVVAAFLVNELEDAARERLRERLLRAASRGASALIVEPIARRPLPWWNAWVSDFRRVGGREETWRFEADLPEPLMRLDRAAGLDHRVLTARCLWIAPR